MHRHGAALVITVLIGGTVPSLAAQQALQPTTQPAAPQAPQSVAAQPAPVVLERQDARETRDRLHELLRQHPPSVGEVLQRDPSLARPDYLAPYPSLIAFLQQHPEVARNPAFFFGSYQYREDLPRDRSYDMFREVTDGFGFLLIFGGLLGAFIWLVKSVIDQRRWLRVSRNQAEAHTKLLDRLTNNEDLLAYIQTPAGRRFLESGPLLTDAGETRPAPAPISRIILSLQAGVVLTFLGMGFWISETRFPEDMGEGFFIIGTLTTALGIGFAVSAALAYLISSRFGLVARSPLETHD
jgi:hypothetical protein